MNVRNWIVIAVFAGAVGAGTIGGIFYAFSSFVMPALGRLTPERATEAMNSINVTVLTPSFLGVFMGMALLCAVLIVGAALHWSQPGAKLVLAAGVAYLLGTFGVTLLLNVPLNNELATAIEPARAMATWPRYLTAWTLWNTVRTTAALVSAGLFTAALRS